MVGRGGRTVTSLADLLVGRSGEVVAVEAPDQAGYRRLFALGLVPGATVTLIQRFPTFVFNVGRTTIAVDGEMAAGIRVATGAGGLAPLSASRSRRGGPSALGWPRG